MGRFITVSRGITWEEGGRREGEREGRREGRREGGKEGGGRRREDSHYAFSLEGCATLTKQNLLYSAYHAVDTEEKGSHSEPLGHALPGVGQVAYPLNCSQEAMATSIHIHHLRGGVKRLAAMVTMGHNIFTRGGLISGVILLEVGHY